MNCITGSLLRYGETDVLISPKRVVQDFQKKFKRKLFRLAKSTPKAIMNWAFVLKILRWCRAYKKLVFLQKVIEKNSNNLCKKTILQEVLLINVHKYALNKNWYNGHIKTKSKTKSSKFKKKQLMRWDEKHHQSNRQVNR